MSLKSLTYGGIVMLAAQLVRLGCGYALLSMLWLALPASDIGRYANFITALAIATPILVLKPEALVTRAYFVSDRRRFQDYMGSAIATILCLSVGGALLIPLLAHVSDRFLALPSGILLLLPVYAIGYGYNYVCSATLQVHGRTIAFAVLRGGEGAIRLVVGGLLLSAGVGWRSAPLGITAGAVIMGLISYRMMRAQTGLNARPILRHAGEYARLGFASVPMTVGLALTQGADKMFLTRFAGLGVVGIYGTGALLASGLWIVANAFQQVWMPFLFTALRDATPESRRGAIRASTLFVILMLFCAVALIAASIVAVALVPALQPFALLHRAFPMLVVAYMLAGVRLLIDNIFYYHARMWALSCIVAGGAASMGALCAWLVPRYGVDGAAASLLIANVATLGASILTILWRRPTLANDARIEP